ncbi:hypothetical protein JHK87_050378 [Glycine soja]|nr:hypothetical protein JHK87_050378 [Glycine soja]
MIRSKRVQEDFEEKDDSSKVVDDVFTERHQAPEKRTGRASSASSTTKTTPPPSLTQSNSISLTPSLSLYQNAQCNARRNRASSRHTLPHL